MERYLGASMAQRLRALGLDRADVALCVFGLVIVAAAFGWGLLTAITPSPPPIPNTSPPSNTSPNPTLVATMVTAWMTISLALAGAAIRVTMTRLNTAKLIASEIRAIQQGILAMGMLPQWAGLAADPALGPHGRADGPRDSDYFAFINALLNHAGNLHPEAVESTIRFYTYLKMSRDAAGSLAKWPDYRPPATDRKKEDVRIVLFLLIHCLVWGLLSRQALGVTFDEHDTELYAEIEVTYDQVFVQPDQPDQREPRFPLTFAAFAARHPFEGLLTKLRSSLPRLDDTLVETRLKLAGSMRTADVAPQTLPASATEEIAS